MKKTFREYYRPDEEGFREIWKNCIFVPDTNVLLGLYRYTSETASELFKIFDTISNRLWIPYQVGLEYHENRLSVISKQIEAYDSIIKEIRSTKDSLQSKLENYTKHPYIKIGDISKKSEYFCSELIKELEKRKSEHPDLFNDDNIRLSITKMLDGKVGKNYGKEQFVKIYELGKKRFEEKMPPGYQDEEKPEKEKYGDLIIWFQIIDKAKESKKPVILITDDIKDDWWLIFKGKTIGPRPELVKEIYDEVEVGFYMYQSDRFMEYAIKYLEQEVTPQSIDEIRTITRIDEKRKEYFKKQLRIKEIDLSIGINEGEEERTRKRLSALHRQLYYMDRIAHGSELTAFEMDERGNKNINDIMAERADIANNIAALQRQLYEYSGKLDRMRKERLSYTLENDISE